MLLLNPKKESFEHLDPKSAEIMKKTISFFEKRGKKKLKEVAHQCEWYQDFLDFVKSEKIFATLLTPASATDGKDTNFRWDTFRNCQFNEILGFYGLSYWYTWQVTILGLAPIWMGQNNIVKDKTAKSLRDGGIFAFGLSEKEHGADIYSTSMKLKGDGTSHYLASGRKYYIGNANEASLVSTFAKFENSGDYVFFVADSQHEKFDCIQNVVNSQNYVAEFELNDYPIGEKEILSKGRDAWDSSLNTVNVGKYNLGWASIGICTHAFYESIDHASNRVLFDHKVTDFTHIKQYFVKAYCKLIAMKLFALRGSDYIRSASADDRRYLLYTPMVKMKVTTQGEEVINLLWNIIAAKGFEKDGYFEVAAVDIRALPKLEGTVHVNMALIIKFMKNYFFGHKELPHIPRVDDAISDDFLFNQGPTKGLSKIRFHDYRKVYNSLDLPNIKIFKKQIRLLKMLLIFAKPSKEQAKDFDLLLNLGELFTLVVYGQLIIENAHIMKIDHQLIDQIFDFMIEDFSKYALNLYSKGVANKRQRCLCKKMIKVSHQDQGRFDHILNTYVTPLNGSYQMNE